MIECGAISIRRRNEEAPFVDSNFGSYGSDFGLERSMRAGCGFFKGQIKVTKVSGNIYMLEGQGGNIAASVGEDGIVIVDDQFAPLADKIQAALKNLGITDKPVRFVINTHYHGDHTGGNAPFANAGSTVIAQDNVRKRMETGGTAGNGGSIKMDVPPAPKAALPIITFDHDVTKE
jgi:cyclase